MVKFMTMMHISKMKKEYRMRELRPIDITSAFKGGLYSRTYKKLYQESVLKFVAELKAVSKPISPVNMAMTCRRGMLLQSIAKDVVFVNTLAMEEPMSWKLLL